MDKIQLDKMIKEHSLWLENPSFGARADYKYANLSYANLSCAILEGAVLDGAILRSANLRGAILKGANLRIYQTDRWTCYIQKKAYQHRLPT